MADSTGTLTVRVPGYPQPIQFADWTHDNLYHTVQFNQGATNELKAFIGSEGQQIPGGGRTLTKADTNIPRSGDNGLSEGWEALIYSIAVQPTREVAINTGVQQIQLFDTPAVQQSRPVHVGGSDPAVTSGGVLFDFLRKTYVRFASNNKVQSEGPAEKYPQGSGMQVFATTTDIEVANNGMPSPKDARVFVLPIWLRANISFYCSLAPSVGLEQPAPGGQLTAWSNLAGTVAYAFDCRVTLNGLVKRPVV